MARLAVSGSNISFNESADARRSKVDSNPPISITDEPFWEACKILFPEESLTLLEELLNTSNPPNLELIRQSVISAAADKQAGRTYSRPDTRSSQSTGAIMPEKRLGARETVRASKIEFRDKPSVNIIGPNGPIRRTSNSSSHSARLLGQAIRGEYRYAMLGLILGLATIIGGVVLGLHGVIGSTSWTAKLLGLESNLNDAPPGVVLFIVGVFLVLLTRPKVNLDNLKG
jgi:hypothetical protein